MNEEKKIIFCLFFLYICVRMRARARVCVCVCVCGEDFNEGTKYHHPCITKKIMF